MGEAWGRGAPSLWCLGKERPLCSGKLRPGSGEGELGVREVETLRETHNHYLTFTRLKEKLLKYPLMPHVDSKPIFG